MCRVAIGRSKGDGPELLFRLHVRNDNREGTPPLVTLKAVCGPGDAAAPVVTIMKPDEDRAFDGTTRYRLPARVEALLTTKTQP